MSWLLSIGLKMIEEGYYFYNLSWTQMRRFCGDVCGIHCPGEVISSHQTVLGASNLTSTFYRKLSDLLMCCISLGKEGLRAHKFV